MAAAQKGSERKMQAQAPDTAPEAPQVAALKKLRVVIRAATRHSAWVEKQCGVSGAQLWILQELKEAPGLRLGEVAARLTIHQTTTSNLVDALVKRGLVQRARADHDQRVVQLTLSAEGRALLARAPRPARGLLAQTLSRLDEQALQALNCGLDAMLVEMGNEGGALEPLPFML